MAIEDTIPPFLLALNLAGRIHGRLQDPRLFKRTGESSFRVEGGLFSEKMHTRRPARCWFIVNASWLGRIPVVGCAEPWCTRDIAGWHMFDDGRICLDHEDRWRKYMAHVAAHRTFDELLVIATEWLLNSTASLLGRHRLKYQGTSDSWDASWDFWAHKEGGERIDKTFVPECKTS